MGLGNHLLQSVKTVYPCEMAWWHGELSWASVAGLWSGLLLHMSRHISCPLSMCKGLHAVLTMWTNFPRGQNAAKSQQSLPFPRCKGPCGAPTFDIYKVHKENHATEIFCLRISDGTSGKNPVPLPCCQSSASGPITCLQ